MGYIVATASQKGGVGKSTLCRMIAREAATNGLTGKIADFDVRQSTTTRWTERPNAKWRRADYPRRNVLERI